MKLLGAIITACLLSSGRGITEVSGIGDKQTSDVAIALSEIINGLGPTSVTILSIPPSTFSSPSSSPSYLLHSHRNPKFGIRAAESYEENIRRKYVGDFIAQLHRRYFKSVIFYDVELYFQYIESMLRGSIESTSLIFCPPYELSERLQERRLAHRLSLFIFYWGAKQPPQPNEVRFEEPIRAVVITRPRKKAFRIYYNQAVPDGDSNLRLVNWFDADNLGLQKVPLLPNAAAVYSNFNGRVFRVPVFHSPPWFWVNYDNETHNMTTTTFTNLMMDDFHSAHVGGVSNDDNDFGNEYDAVNVSGGRDHRLLQLLARHMNFQYVYIETPGRTQGSMRIDGAANDSFTGAIGLLQLGLADLLLGDVSLSWERRKAVEFSFFTLADSGAFATHAPRRLNEALAIIRPFKLNVWPYLILTIVLSGPIFYAIIAIPYSWSRYAEESPVQGPEPASFHMAYIKEITLSVAARRLNHPRCVPTAQKQIPKDLLDRCIWFTVQVFLKQSFKELYHGYRAKFLMIVYCIAATYVLADVYSAQLTSQFARPAREPPIDNLQRLQDVMLKDGYKLFVEKESSSLEMLENGTEIFRHLFALMKQQKPKDDDEGYLIDSVEAGLRLIADGFENKAILGGRETLYFNIKQFGSKGFQLSHKLYTRYSAVAVQIGCPFLDSLNDVIIHLFEGGILDKMTSAEYETQSRLIAIDFKEQQQQGHASSSSSSSGVTSPAAGGADTSRKDEPTGQETSGSKGAESTELPRTAETGVVIQPLNLRMLQGAFIVLVFGHGSAAIVFLMELLLHHLNFNFVRFCRINFWTRCFRMAMYRVRLLMRN